MKIITWNVNGLRSFIKKINLNNFLKTHKPDIFCMSEIKLSCPISDFQKELEESIKGLKYRYWSPCIIKKGYSGTSIWCKNKPLNIIHGMGITKHDMEGRLITLEYAKYFIIHVYVPNSGDILQRLKYRTLEWDLDFINFAKKLNKKKPIIICGDLNVAHQDIDIHNPIGNRRTAGFTKMERENFTKLLIKLNLEDSFRLFNPTLKDQYTYWSYRYSSRKKNKGWRLDYFLVSERIKQNIKKSSILTKQEGSDHAPIVLNISW